MTRDPLTKRGGPIVLLVEYAPVASKCGRRFWVPLVTREEVCFDKYEWILISTASMQGLHGLLSAMHGYIKKSSTMP
ncbi:hypothetical protein CRG98_032459 [Punica granatum]|uniref:Uncharacterized protein n=1 Tax=Punica granatum TaxID=22663 RepID=A0A2I0IT06_PUNGR|nr:hypothetical protein CRG98_032459 [Punica granatum]